MPLEYDCVVGCAMEAIGRLWVKSDECDKEKWVRNSVHSRWFWYNVAKLADEIHVQDIANERERIRVENERDKKKLEDRIMELQIENLRLFSESNKLKEKFNDINKIINL